MKTNHRRKEKWAFNTDSNKSESGDFSKNKAKTERRERHKTKIKRLHQYHHLKDLFGDWE